VAGVSAVDAHYFFPPASAYPLNRFLFALKSDTAVRERYATDPEVAMREHGLDGDARAALAAADRDRLVALGAHPYLVFMAQVRLSMTRDPGSFEYF
jgi:Aromatic-ring-opening dioxygenase LigAB, LigA subunit